MLELLVNLTFTEFESDFITFMFSTEDHLDYEV